jgi:autotransporter-associated beta strand protein
VTKNSNGTPLSGSFNAYTGGTTISSGTLNAGTLANGGSASDIGAASSSAKIWCSTVARCHRRRGEHRSLVHARHGRRHD